MAEHQAARPKPSMARCCSQLGRLARLPAAARGAPAEGVCDGGLGLPLWEGVMAAAAQASAPTRRWMVEHGPVVG